MDIRIKGVCFHRTQSLGVRGIEQVRGRAFLEIRWRKISCNKEREEGVPSVLCFKGYSLFVVGRAT
jgi:hypothetical protein